MASARAMCRSLAYLVDDRLRKCLTHPCRSPLGQRCRGCGERGGGEEKTRCVCSGSGDWLRDAVVQVHAPGEGVKTLAVS